MIILRPLPTGSEVDRDLFLLISYEREDTCKPAKNKLHPVIAVTYILRE